MRSGSRLRPIVVLGLATTVVAVPGAAIGSTTHAAGGHAADIAEAVAAKKKRQPRKGRAKPDKTTAGVTGSWTITRSDELNNGVESEQVTVTIKDGKATFPDQTGRVATGKADVAIAYEGRFSTDDRSWHAGCDHEERTSTATFHDTLPIVVFATSRRSVGGKEQRLANGWAVEVAWPSIRKMGLVTTGYFEDWESIAMEKCERTPISAPLGHWNVQFATTLTASGSLNGGGAGVLLTRAETSSGQTEKTDGRITFSKSVERR